MTADISVSQTRETGRYEGDTADVVAQIPASSLLVSAREHDDFPTVKVGLSYAQADALAAGLTGAVPDDWKAEAFGQQQGVGAQGP